MDKIWRKFFACLIQNAAGDEDKKRRGEILSILLLAIFAVVGLLTGLNLVQAFSQKSGSVLFDIFWDLIALGTMAAAWVINRRGHVRFACYFFLVLALAGGLASFPIQDLEKVMIIFSIPILAASFLIAPASSFFFASLSAAGYTILYFISQTSEKYDNISVPLFFVLALVAWLVASRLERALAEASRREVHYKAMFESNRAIQLLVDPDSAAILDANQAACEYFGYPLEGMKTRLASDLNGRPPERVQGILGQIKSGEFTYFVSTAITASGEWRDIEIYPSLLQLQGKPAVYLIVHDITKRKKAEELALHQSQKIELLYEASRAFSSTLDLKVIYAAIHQFVARMMPCDSLFVSSYDPRDKLIRGSYAWVDQTEIDASQLPPIPLEDEGRGVQSRVIRSGEALLLPDYDLYMNTAASRYYVDETGKTVTEPSPDEERARSGILVPLKVSGSVVGVVQVMSDKLNDYNEEHLHFLEALATHASSAITNARLFAELEKRYEERSAQLDDVSHELDAFTNSISHNLQAPVRGIHGFTQILKENYAGLLPEEAQKYLNLIQANAAQMNQLTEGLLALSRLERHSLNIQPVSPKAIVEQVLDELRPGMEGRQVKISVAELPPVKADPLMLRQVYLNLLSNALKFTRLRQEAAIEVGYLIRSSPDSGAGVGSGKEYKQIVYFVRDNGEGFDTHYADRLFGVFQRLHSSQKYEGSGIGLSIVRRIVTRHSGRVWAESEIDHGATFFFTLGDVKAG